MARPRFRSFVLAILATALLATAAPAAIAADGVSVRSNVIYGTGAVKAPKAGRVDLPLDLYLPTAKSKAARSYAVLIHGGGFTGGTRTQPEIVRIANALAQRGVVVASIDYRLMGQSPVPSARVQALAKASSKAPLFNAMVTAVDDTLTAVDYLERNARSLRIDTDRLGLVGGSAGAITSDHVAYVLDRFGIRAPKVRVVGDLWGGIFLPAATKAAADASLNRGDAALFSVHGDADKTVPVILDDYLNARAKAVGVRDAYYRVPGGGHGFGGTQFFTRKVAGNQTAFDRLLPFVTTELNRR